MELEYSCSTERNPHRLRTAGLIQCNDYIGCMIEKLNLKKPGREIQHLNLETEQYTVCKIGGDCEDCAMKKTELIQNEERAFRELEEELQEEERSYREIVEEIQNEDEMYREIQEGIQNKERSFRERQKEANNNGQSLSRWIRNKLVESHDEILGLRLYGRGAAVQRPETICSSGPCTGPVVVTDDGEKGMFCEKHTCSAKEWSCLMDAATPPNSNQYSIYCSAHTYGRFGCGLRITNPMSNYCTMHQTQMYMDYVGMH